ncbi:MAG TPA: hypothetical protein VGP08_08925 [Pyrinomonadaceae bacterium]|jgi:hypothetical protein|nr:hypothetical protein [Pyrinomonadaceae bacterium]
MPERFINDGRGWECKRCREEDASALGDDADESEPSSNALARFFREGEAEEREPRLSSSALARWKDDARRALACPRCGTEEILSE